MISPSMTGRSSSGNWGNPFEEVGVNRIDSRHDPRNPHSGQVMAKCGMVYEGTHRQSDRNNQGICDAAWYAILKEDYEKGRECP